MKRVLITGMSGIGKSTVVEDWSPAATGGRRRPMRTIGNGDRTRETSSTGPGPGKDWVWREDRIQELLSTEDR